MKYAWLGCLLAGSLLFAGNQDSETNVNTRYTVENVTIQGDGWSTDPAVNRDQKLSSGLRREIASLVGEKLNPAALDDLAKRLRKELHARTVEHHVLRGKQPEYVQVVFDVKLRPTRFDVSVPKFLYQSRQGWSGAVEGTAAIHQNGFTLGLVSDGDDLMERYSGIEARYENSHLGTDRARLAFEFDSFHEVWNPATLAYGATASTSEGAAGDFYRTRENFQPTVTFVVARPLTVSFGASFERMEPEGPISVGAPHMEAANSWLAGVNFHQQVEDAQYQQDFNATYDLRMGTHSLGSDFAYGRHRWQFRYAVTHGKHTLSDEATAGVISGQAPLFERFVLGNSTTLRGWNKYDIDPLGGNRMLHNSVEYRYGALQVFYDSGAIWDPGQAVIARNSIGFGMRQGPFFMAVAFPLRDGRVDPIFMVGMNY
ncbi:MAG TPA: BamA/TamA family outer membrane protein [Bryobacteraceae bacterium]|nr:BamA/TamA family outer membrane protein [Bryobacteraceae bacterium]